MGRCLYRLLALCAALSSARSQLQRGGGVFELPDLSRSLQPAKPKVDPELAGFFGLQGQAGSLVDSLLGPRPGVIPPRPYDIKGEPPSQQHLRQRQPFFSGFGGGPPGTNAGFNPFAPNAGVASGAGSASFGGPVPTRPDGFGTGKGGSGSSIAGIPNIFPELPKAPRVAPAPPAVARPPQQQRPQAALSLRQTVPSAPVQLPQLAGRPEVPTGGLGPLAAQSLAPFNTNGRVPAVGQPQLPTAFNPQSFGTGGAPQGGPFGAANFGQQQAQGDGATGGLLNNIFKLVGLGANGQLQSGADVRSLLAQQGQQAAAAGAGQPGGAGALNNILYRALTNGAIQPQSDAAGNETDAGGPPIDPELLRQNTAETLTQNIALIQQLVTQPNSPLCSPKPEPVDTFDMAAFMGTWYQVLYSPPMSVGPCSMISYKKLADVNNGGPGSVFDTFEYTTEGTPFGPPRISSGYAIVRAPGQLIYRTTSSDSDVNVNVVAVGPKNSEGEYEWAVLSVNCNYPLHVFARDPVRYKQLYEPGVSAMLEQNGMVTGFTRLLNVVAPVDNSLCHFPPTLFNI